MISRRQLLLTGIALLSVAVVTGCGHDGGDKVDLADVADLASETLVGTLIGPRPQEQSTGLGTPEPPLLQKGSYESVQLATDTASFAHESKGALSEQDLKAIETDVVKRTSQIFKKQGFTITSIPFPPKPDLTTNSLLATFTPATEEGGSPEDKKAGKAPTFVLIRLTVSDPKTNTVLRVREFYSGRDARRPDLK